MYSTQQQISLEYHGQSKMHTKLQVSIHFTVFIVQERYFSLGTETQLVNFRYHLHHLHPEKILPDWMQWLTQQQAVLVGPLVASVAIPAGPVLLAAA